MILKGTSITVEDTTVTGLDLAILLTLTDYYTVIIDEVDYCFRVLTRTSKDLLTIEWVQLDGDPSPALKPPTFPAVSTEIHRGFSSTNSSLYKMNFLNRGYLDIDNIVFDMFYQTLSKWDWLGDSFENQFEDKNPRQFVDFFFNNKRPITRQPYAEKTLGASDNVDLTWQTDKEASNPSSVVTHPFMTFQAVTIVPYSEELYRIEEFYKPLDNVPAEILGEVEDTFRDLEVYQPPQIHEFSYQITAVTDSFKDARLLQSHLYQSLVPKDRGERYVEFPSGMKHSVEVEMSDIISLEDEGTFEVTLTYIFKLPLVDRHPELTYSWITQVLNVSQI